MRKQDLTGRRFGRLVVLNEGPKRGKHITWNCLCDCGGRKCVQANHLCSGAIVSCRCHMRECLKLDKSKPAIYLRKGVYGICITATGRWFIFDWEDHDKIRRFQWQVEKGYIVSVSKGNRLSLPRLLTSCPDGYVVDHKDRNTRNNCKENLRVCLPEENAKNRTARGYYLRGKKWVAHIRFDGKLHYLGTFATEEEARSVRYAAEKKYFGEFAPDRGVA